MHNYGILCIVYVDRNNTWNAIIMANTANVVLAMEAIQRKVCINPKPIICTRWVYQNPKGKFQRLNFVV